MKKNVTVQVARKKLYVIVTLLCLIMAVGVVSNDSTADKVYAATNFSKKNKDARKAFNKFLSKSKIAWPTSGNLYPGKEYSFQYMELGKNKIPVLIIVCSRTYHMEQFVAVLQYSNGTVKLMCADDAIQNIYVKSGMIAISDLSNGALSTWYYKLNNKGKLKKVACTRIWGTYMNQEDEYQIGSKWVSKSSFEKWLKKNTNNEKGKAIGKWCKNTAKNRKKYLLNGK